MCDTHANADERIGCLKEDLSVREMVKEYVAVLGDPSFRTHLRHDHSNRIVEVLAGDDKKPAAKKPAAPAVDPNLPKVDQEKLKTYPVYLTDREWYIFVFGIAFMAFYCEFLCLLCFGLYKGHQERKQQEEFVRMMQEHAKKQEEMEMMEGDAEAMMDEAPMMEEAAAE